MRGPVSVPRGLGDRRWDQRRMETTGSVDKCVWTGERMCEQESKQSKQYGSSKKGEQDEQQSTKGRDIQRDVCVLTPKGAGQAR